MKSKKKPLWRTLGITAFVVIIILLILTYIGISLFFEDHYYYRTFINGEDFSYKTPVEAEEMLYTRLYSYSLEIVGREEMYDTILPPEIEMEYVFDDSLVRIKQEQKPGLWLAGFLREHSYDLPHLVEYKKDALDQKLDRLVFFRTENIRAPSDAYITYAPEKKQYIIIGGKPGTEIDRVKAAEAIGNAAARMETKLDLEAAGCYTTPRVERDNEELNEALALANRYVSAEVTYDWNGNEVIVDADTVNRWVTVEKDRVRLDGDKIKEFIEGRAQKYDTYGKNRIFRTTDGREIELKSNAYGWKTDTDTEAEALIKSVKNGETISREPAYSYTAAETGQQDIGASYVEIDLSGQHLYLYVDAELILESDFVSGNASRGWNTPAGVFGLTYKTKNAVLRGEGYETPVSYWMPFNGNIGMHDATWRGAFGGDIYLTNGSHGCINLPYENAEIIYQYVYTGFPVVCYY